MQGKSKALTILNIVTNIAATILVAHSTLKRIK